MVSEFTDLGNGLFSASLPAANFPSDVARNTPITALAFDTNNNTSEFGDSVDPIVTNTDPVSYTHLTLPTIYSV